MADQVETEIKRKIRALFEKYNVSLTAEYTGSSEQRVDQIFNDLISGKKTGLDQLETQVAGVAKRNPTQPYVASGSYSTPMPFNKGTATIDQDGITITPGPGASPNAAATPLAPDTSFESERADARAEVEAVLLEFFTPAQVEELLRTVVDPALLENESDVEIMQRIRDSTPYLEKFPGMQLRRDNDLAPIDEYTYMTLIDDYKEVFKGAELPPGFWDSNEDLADLIGRDVSVAELEFRIMQGYEAARHAPAEVREELSRFYGVGNADAALAMYYMDPEKGEEEIVREFQAAQIGAVSKQTSFGQISLGQAEDLANSGVTQTQAKQGFSSLVRDQELMRSGPGEVGGTQFNQQQQIDAVFDQDEDILEEIRKQRERRLAAFSGSNSGGVANQTGTVGLRNANT